MGGILSAPGGQQTSSTCDLDQITSCAAEPFATGSEMLVDPVHKMIHCNMPKNADNVRTRIEARTRRRAPTLSSPHSPVTGLP